MSVDVANAVARFFRAVDERAWSELRGLMTAPFHLDYASFGGGEAADLDPEAIIEGWAGFLPGFEHTHHQLGNLELELRGEAATVRCVGTAIHALEGEVWTVLGSYDAGLVREQGRWKLSSLRFDLRTQAGALDLPAKATERLSAPPPVG